MTFTATVSGSGPTPTGTVTFYDGGTCLAPGTTLGSGFTLSTSALAAGTHTILACYSGDVNYASSSGSLSKTVSAVAVTVTAVAATKVYGSADPALSYTVTSGSLVSDDGFTGALTRVSGENVGAYAIQQGTLALSSNYALTFVGANLTITVAPLTFTASNATRSYGASNPPFTGTIVGLQNNDNITATYSTAATITSPAGTYAIVPAPVDPGNNLGNYSVTLNNGVLTITAVAVTPVSVNPTSIDGRSRRHRHGHARRASRPAAGRWSRCRATRPVWRRFRRTLPFPPDRTAPPSRSPPAPSRPGPT